MKKVYLALGVVPYNGPVKDIYELYSDDFIKVDGQEKYVFHSVLINPQITMSKRNRSILITVASDNESTTKEYMKDVRKKLVVDINPPSDETIKFYDRLFNGEVEFIK